VLITRMMEVSIISTAASCAPTLDSLRPGPQVRFQGEADMDRQATPDGSVENDPQPT
jgi:hypothetical protein